MQQEQGASDVSAVEEHDGHATKEARRKECERLAGIALESAQVRNHLLVESVGYGVSNID
jgi:hypothetical protein